MNILILSGSPRKGGNTDLLVEAFVKGLSPKHDVEIVSVRDFRISPCMGCNYCFRNESHACVQKDDMSIIYEKMALADMLVIASPFSFFLGRHTNRMLRGIVELVKTFYRASNTWRLSPYLHDAPCFILLYIQTNQNLHIHHHPGQTSQASRL